MIDIKTLKRMNIPDKIAITKHARQRLEERKIMMADIIYGIKTGEIIKQYEDDFIYLITAYYPTSEHWENDFKTRKE